MWLGAGLLCLGVGAIGVVVPGLPTTVFAIMAAAAFAKSSPRLLEWLLAVPVIGESIADYRAGLGMPSRAKVSAVTSIVVFAGAAVLFAFESATPRVVVGLVALTGIAVVLRQPTRTRPAVEEPTDHTTT